jgi:hypothetical protein
MTLDQFMNAHPIFEAIVSGVIVVFLVAVFVGALMGSLGRDV